MVVSNKLGAVFGGQGGKASPKSLGVGYFFGSLFYMASIGRLPILSLPQYYVLKWIVEGFRTVTHLPLDILGEIKWCFFPSFGALGIFACQFLGPVVATVVLAAMYISVWLCPTALSKFHPSPMQSISLLILFTFWSVAATSINILQYKEVGDDIRVQIQPDLPYFTGIHFPLAIISVVLLLFLIFPLVSFLMFSPFLWRCVNLSKVKPFIDEFQSCYKKQYRWYPAIYFIAWVIIVGTDNLKTSLTIYALVFFLLCILTTVFQPYEVKWLNTVDMLLLLDLLVLTMLLQLQVFQAVEENKVVTGIVYTLVLLPLLFISFGIAFLFAIQCKPLRQKPPTAQNETHISMLRVMQPTGSSESHAIYSYCRDRDFDNSQF